MADTHLVTNQVPTLENYNTATSPVLTEALIREGGEWGLDEVAELGALSGSRLALRWGELADRNQPILHPQDPNGHRVDEVEYDPAYHELMKAAIGHGLHAAPWADDRPGAHVVRAAKMSAWTPEPGHVCPISMTYAVVPALRHNAELAAVYEPLLASREYDPELKVPATKVGITAGMSMTEKQGGSDVRAGTTQATPRGDGTYSLIGRKGFGAYLIDQPLRRNVLADLAVEAEAATMVAMRMAGATDAAVRGDEREILLRRIGLAASKYWVCKRATPHAAEAMECLGGNGYVEESGMPRLYREAPLMGIWEGSGNVSALDTLRAMATRPECIDVLFDELAKTGGQDPRLDAHVDALKPALADFETIQYRARKIAEDISLALQGSLLVRYGH